MDADVKAQYHSPTEGGAERPFFSENPVYSDTWGVATVDPDSNQAYWAQVLHNASTGRARHLLMVISDGKSSCDYAYTEAGDPFHSDLMDVELDGWNSYRVTSKRKNLDLTAVSGHDPVDFGKLLTFKDFSLGHQESGALTTGQINGIPFRGMGLRDRSFGPRPMGGVGQVNSVILISEDLKASFAANLVHGGPTGLINDPDTKFAFVSTPDGQWFTSDLSEIGVRRQSDGLAVGLRIRDHELTITREVGNHHYTPHWYPSIDLSIGERRILHHVIRFVEGHHPVYGRMAGLVDQASLVPC